MEASKSIKVLFTGDLNRKIVTNPFYFKSEKEYLRSVIARISFSTTLVPRDVYQLQEDSTTEIEEKPAPDEGPRPMKTTQEMCKLSNWVHYTRNILQCNRLKHAEPEAEDDEALEKAKKLQESQDPYEPRLKSIDADEKVKGGYAAWSIRQHGDRMVYAPANPAYQNQNYSVVVVKSNFWPGSFTFFNEGKWSQIYVGDGQKHETHRYFPVNPPVVCADPEEPRTSPEVS